MGELRVRVPYCVESCEVPKERSAAPSPCVCVCVCRRAQCATATATATGGSSSSSSFCGTRSWPGCALPGQEGQGPGPGTYLALFLVSDVPVPLSPAVYPKGEWPNLSLHLTKMQGRRQTASPQAPFSFVRRACRPDGDQGLSAQDPRKAFQALPGPKSPQLPFTCPKRLGPAGQVSDSRCRWRNNPASPLARQPKRHRLADWPNWQNWQGARQAKSRERRP